MAWVGAGKGRGGRPWRRKRESVMKRDNYLCQPCRRAGRITEAREVDHIVELHEGGSDEEPNLQAICVPCHKAKTNGLDEGAKLKREHKTPRVRMLKASRVAMIS